MEIVEVLDSDVGDPEENYETLESEAREDELEIFLLLAREVQQPLTDVIAFAGVGTWPSNSSSCGCGTDLGSRREGARHFVEGPPSSSGQDSAFQGGNTGSNPVGNTKRAVGPVC